MNDETLNFDKEQITLLLDSLEESKWNDLYEIYNIIQITILMGIYMKLEQMVMMQGLYKQIYLQEKILYQALHLKELML